MLLTADPAAFPPTPPPSFDDPQTIARHDWAAFDAVKKMKNHWDRPGWSATTRAYYWMLTFAGATPLIDQIRYCQAQLKHLDFDPIDKDGLHLTLGRICLAHEASTAQLERLVEAAADHRVRAFSIQALPLTASHGAIRYSIAPWTPLITLHTALSSASTRSALPLRKPTNTLRPHIGIAYCDRTMDTASVRGAIRPLRSLPPVNIPVEQVELVELRREKRSYRWDTVHRLPLL